MSSCRVDGEPGGAYCIRAEVQYVAARERLHKVAAVHTEESGVVAEGVDPFRTLAREQLPHLYAVARRMVGSEAEDAVQDCLLRAFQRFDQLRDATAGRAWLTRILVNCCHDRARARARQPEQVELDGIEEFSLYQKIAYEDPFPYSDTLHVDFLGCFGAADVTAVLMRLPELYRIPLVLVYMDGYLAREVAEMLDAPLGTVLARLHRGRKLFEREMWAYAASSGLLRGGDR
jgi:RNA polymerase sigma-70 factor (ECF subfamily)